MNSKRLPFWPVYPADVIADSKLSRLTAEEFGCFWRLCLHSWLSDGMLSGDEDELKRLCGVNHPRTWRKVWPKIEPLFSRQGVEDGIKGGDTLLIPEVHSAYLAALERSEKARNKAEKRWGGHAAADATADANRGEGEERKSEKKSEEKAKASLRVPKAHASPSPSRAGECRSLTQIMERSGLVEKPPQTVEEVEPTQADIEAKAKKVAGWGVNELVCYVAKGSQKAKLTDTLNDALGRIPEPRLRELCCFVMAKADRNKGWGTEKMAAVLTQRCKALMEGTAA